jgi:two-component system, NtrC family, sensor kinase
MRRPKAGGKPAKARRRRTTTLRRRNASKAVQTERATIAGEMKVASLKRELSELAEQQRATGQILRLINTSGDLQPVFASILQSAVRLCDAHNGVINRWDGEALHLIAAHEMPAAYVELRRQSPARRFENSASGRMLATRTPLQIADLAADRAYLEGDPPTVAAVELGGVRATLAVPMFKDRDLVGSLTLGRREVRPFSKRQSELLQNFATHAVIAIENARLFQELRETLEQQAAAADILKVISHSTFDLQAVLDTVLEMAVRLCGADLGAVHPKRGHFPAFSTYGGPADHRDVAATLVLDAEPGSVMGRAALEGKPVQVADVLSDPNYGWHGTQQRLGYRTVLGVPLLREGEPIGVIALMRSAVRPFTDRQIALVQNFANQAVIAIENTRLLAELRKRTDQLGRSVVELRRERNNKLMNLEAMVAALSHEVRQPLASIAANGSAALRFLGHAPPNLEEVQSALNRMVGDSHRASGVFDNIRALFGKTDRGHEPIEVNELLRSVLDGVHGELDDHAITAGVALAADLPPVLGHRGQLQEVFTNLVHNAIEAMHADDDGHRVLQVRTQRLGVNKVMVAVEDSGPGIDPNQPGNIFEAFITTKSQGTGLGLALAKMIVERHSGQISAAPAHPRGMVFRVVLPIGRLPVK